MISVMKVKSMQWFLLFRVSAGLEIAGNIMLEILSSEQVSGNPNIDRDWWKDS